ncbi:Uncharacterised protein [Actinobacillus equuli]|nr:Uncharacterised protein [Actinobacillus equuli]
MTDLQHTTETTENETTHFGFKTVAKEENSN